MMTGKKRWILGLILSADMLGTAVLAGTKANPGHETAVITSGQLTEVSAPADFKHYRFELRAYNQGTLVATAPYETDAQSEQQLAILVGNTLALWAQSLNQKGIQWNRLTPIFLGN